jgi:hypothetical protein
MSYTKGPWKINKAEIIGNNNKKIAHVIGQPISNNYLELDYKTSKANAKLISAAPDLFEACKDAIAQINYLFNKVPKNHLVEPTTMACLKLLNQAINKAIGE